MNRAIIGNEDWMELRQLWKIVRRRWWIILLPTLAALVYAGYSALRTPPSGSFAVTMQFTAAEPANGQAQGYEDSNYYPWLASEYVVNALTDWVRTSSFASDVSADLSAQGIDIPAGALQGRISADNERSVMRLYLSWHDAEQLAAIAGAASRVLQNRSGSAFPQIGPDDLVVVPLDQPAIAAVPPPASTRLDPLIRAGLGLAAGVALAFLADYLDPTLRERAEVEALGLTVLAEIPPRGSART
jgi:capsular polysaccharide biosynthesis protein